MKRRHFLHHSTQAALAAALLPLAVEATASATVPTPPAAPDLTEATIADLQALLQSGKASSRTLCAWYLDRIAAIDRAGPLLKAVIELNPDALAQADTLDQERKAGKLRGPLHGIPVLVKDNLDTADKMQTTAGATALAGHHAQRDAFAVAQLRAAGAILLGKTNLSEWANFRSTHSMSGWSSRGGQTRNPYVLDRTTSGSSAGSGAAVAASLCAVAVGTETNGSIVSPSSCCGLVGLKPTVGLVSRTGIIPISATQDTAGPMARTVRDAAILLGGLVGMSADPADKLTMPFADTSAAGGLLLHSNPHIYAPPSPDQVPNALKDAPDYTRLLGKTTLSGQRLGVEKSHLAHPGPAGELLRQAVAIVKHEGATVVEVDVLAATRPLSEAEFDVLLYEFKDGVNKYLAQANAPMKTLADVIAYNRAHAAQAMPFFQQEILEQAEKTDGLASPKYQEEVKRTVTTARQALDAALASNGGLAAILGITGSPAACIDLITGEYDTGPDYSSPAALAGYPHLTVPMGQVHGLPVGLSFVAGPHQEAELLALGYAYEQATKWRKAPTFQQVVGY